jgi:hypothetical protein
MSELGTVVPEEELAIWFIKIRSKCGTYIEICGHETGTQNVLCGMTKEEAEEAFAYIEKDMLGLVRTNTVEVIKL